VMSDLASPVRNSQLKKTPGDWNFKIIPQAFKFPI